MLKIEYKIGKAKHTAEEELEGTPMPQKLIAEILSKARELSSGKSEAPALKTVVKLLLEETVQQRQTPILSLIRSLDVDGTLDWTAIYAFLYQMAKDKKHPFAHVDAQDGDLFYMLPGYDKKTITKQAMKQRAREYVNKRDRNS